MPFINIPSYGSASWKDPVADPVSLPASGNELGDARVTESTSEIYVWDGSAWQNVGGSSLPAFDDDKVLYSTSAAAEWRTVGTGSTTAAYPADTVIVGRAKPAFTGTFPLDYSKCVIIGSQAADAATSGQLNVIIGWEAAKNYNAQTQQNVIIGAGAGTGTGGRFRSTMVGSGAQAASDSVSIGQATNCAGVNSVALGSGTYADTSAISIGAGAASNNSSIAIGIAANTFGLTNSMVIGSSISQINTVYLGRGGFQNTTANAVKIMTMRSGGTDIDMSVGTLTIAGAQGTGTGPGGDVIIATAPPDVSSGSSLNAHVERMRVTDDGDVGINVVAPTKKFHVFDGPNQCVATFQSDTTGGGITLQDSTTTSDTHVGIGANGDDLCFRSGGFVGANMTLDASGNLKVPNYILSPVHYDEGTETTNFTIDWANSPVQTVTLDGTSNATVTLSNPVQGGAYVLRVIQGATPGTIDFTAGGFADAVWPGGTAPTLSGTTGDVDLINLLYIDDGGGTVTYYGTFATDFS